jgi:hypothetical protein
MSSESTTTLAQKSFLKGSQKFQIMNDGNLACSFTFFLSHREIKVPLFNIDPNPQRIKARAIGPIFYFVFFALVSLFFFWGAFALPESEAKDGVLTG